MSDNECIFCQIGSGEIPTEKVFESETVVGFYDNSPSAEHHVLIIPKKHVATFLDLTDSDQELFNDLRLAAQKLIVDLDLSGGYRLVFNGGRYQHVPHMHWHLLSGQLIKLP